MIESSDSSYVPIFFKMDLFSIRFGKCGKRESEDDLPGVKEKEK